MRPQREGKHNSQTSQNDVCATRGERWSVVRRQLQCRQLQLCVGDVSVTIALGPHVTSPQGVDRLETVKTFAILDSNEGFPWKARGVTFCLPGVENVFAECCRS